MAFRNASLDGDVKNMVALLTHSHVDVNARHPEVHIAFSPLLPSFLIFLILLPSSYPPSLLPSFLLSAFLRPNVHVPYPPKTFATPLILAASACRVEVCRLLLAHNADVNARDQVETSVPALSVVLIIFIFIFIFIVIFIFYFSFYFSFFFSLSSLFRICGPLFIMPQD